MQENACNEYQRNQALRYIDIRLLNINARSLC